MTNRKRTELSKAEITFCHEFAIDENAKRAFKKAFPKRKLTEMSARNAVFRLLKNAHIQTYLKKLRREYIRSAGTTLIKIYREYVAIAHSDITQCFDLSAEDGWHLLTPRDIPRQVRMAIGSIHVEDTQWGRHVKITMKDKIAALDKLADHCGFSEEMPDTEKILALIPEHMRDAVRQMLEEYSSVPKAPR